ncbi:3-hydroxyacyl-CoA dehydrogenase NAD-binding domain-containing protein [Paraburkholderia bannensis]|uniref:3-hydroxyacyl-CoA dehydrogenase NAD-binding domain-containing protein n=1 Tax=Paraburkholderia bannensis TaxID=765414 RepID=UPI002AB6D2BF|nr:3-hydroxyacyl-CoA dehydrogenase NAD-binding domain-containing protein [Paraburkholderia bannensis]
MQNLAYEVDRDGVALLGIDVPGRTLNVLTPALQQELSEALDRIAADSVVKGAVLYSLKPRGFVAGADLKDLVNAFDRGISVVQARDESRRLQAILRRMETLGKPFATALGGLALGGGLELALGTHFRVLADDVGAVVGLPEVTVGLLPGGGGTQRLPRLIGIVQALPMLLEGKPVDAKEALALGIVDELAPAAQIVERARAWVLAHPEAQQPWDRRGWTPRDAKGAPFNTGPYTGAIARLHASNHENYPAPIAILSAVAEGMAVGIDAGLRIESNYFGKLLAGPVARNLIRTQFINKPAAEKLVRRPAQIAQSRVTRLAVLGAGMMGRGIARVAADAGVDVVLLDADQAGAQRARAALDTAYATDVSRDRITQADAQAALARIRTTADYALLADADLVIEAVFEDRAIKNDVIARAAAVMPGTALFASNTSTLPITGLAARFPRADRFIGLHFFSPVPRMPLVEVIRGRETSDETLARALDFVKQLRKTPIVVNDSPGFFTSRVFGSYVDEGFMMLKEGVAPALIENAARAAGMPIGPLAVADEVSLPLQLKVNEQAVADGLDARFQRGAAIDLVRKMVRELDRPGRPNGFYEYPADAEKRLWPGLAQHWPMAAEQPTLAELRLRFLTIQALEAARCVEEGVIETAADADLGSTLGIGYPTWTGGTLSYIDTRGARAFVSDCEQFAAKYGERYAPSDWLRERAERNETFHRAQTAA